jgi:manganese-transporting P-type ATPase
MALKQQEDFQKEYAELLAKGESWAMYKAMQNMYKRTVDEQKKRVGDSNTLAGSAGRMAAMMDDLENMEDVQLPMVKIGDASVASPFTSKMPSIKGCVDIIRQVSPSLHSHAPYSFCLSCVSRAVAPWSPPFRCMRSWL